jgi:hypothetical protein
LIEEPYIKNYRIQYKKSEGSEWNSILETAELSARWDNLTIGDYIVRIAAVTTNNKVSIFIQANNLGAKLVSSFNNKNNSFFAGEF